MKRILLISLFSFIPLYLLSQKVPVKIAETKDRSVSEWEILDEKFNSILLSKEYQGKDTAVFPLEANKRYFLAISVQVIEYPDTFSLSLLLNDEPIIHVRIVEPGDKLVPFFTGRKTDVDSKITGGSDADISEFPWQVYLEAGKYTCGGSIISNEWIITAAHCTKGEFNEPIPASEMDVIVGANNPRNSSQGKKYFVSEVIVHDLYDLQTYNNDIAVLRLKEPVDYPNALPIKIISEKDSIAGATDPGVISLITGYGITKVNPPVYPSTLQKLQLPLVTNEQASEVWPVIPETDMMAGYLTGNKDACIGDSGGPLVVPVSGGYKLAGLVSWGSTQCNTYGAYTRLSLFESWITAKTGIEITFRAPVPAGDSIICSGVQSSDYYVDIVSGATSYNWILTPQNAGTITGNTERITVTWNPSFTGRVSISLQVSRNTELSEKSELIVNVAKITSLLSEPGDTFMCAGQPLVLKVKAEGYNLTYTWFKNDTLVFSDNTGEYTISSAGAEYAGYYYSRVGGSCGDIVTGTLSLTVLPVTQITNITPDSEVPFGEDLLLEVNAGGHNLAYQWYKDENRLDNGNIPDYLLQNADANDIGLYKASVSGTCGTETSSNIYIYVKKEGSREEPEIYIWPTVINEEFRVAVSDDQKYNILLTSNTGGLLKESRKCQYLTVINTGELAAGIYIVTVYNNYFRKSVKLIKR